MMRVIGDRVVRAILAVLGDAHAVAIGGRFLHHVEILSSRFFGTPITSDQ